MLRRIRIAPSTSVIVHISSTVFCNLTVSAPAYDRFSYVSAFRVSRVFNFIAYLALQVVINAASFPRTSLHLKVGRQTVYGGQRLRW